MPHKCCSNLHACTHLTACRILTRLHHTPGSSRSSNCAGMPHKCCSNLHACTHLTACRILTRLHHTPGSSRSSSRAGSPASTFRRGHSPPPSPHPTQDTASVWDTTMLIAHGTCPPAAQSSSRPHPQQAKLPASGGVAQGGGHSHAQQPNKSGTVSAALLPSGGGSGEGGGSRPVAQQQQQQKQPDQASRGRHSSPSPRPLHTSFGERGVMLVCVQWCGFHVLWV